MSIEKEQPAVVYEVTATVEPALWEEYEQFMVDEHIPDVLRTNCFRRAKLAKSRTGIYRARYEAVSQSELDRYLTDHATGLRSSFLVRFPTGIAFSRDDWELIKHFA